MTILVYLGNKSFLIQILLNYRCNLFSMNFLFDFSKIRKFDLMHCDINFKINRNNQITTDFLGIIFLSNISITNSNHYQGILISEIYKPH